jgi:uncharacterized protein YkwD
VGRRATSLTAALVAALAVAAPVGATSDAPILLKVLQHHARGRHATAARGHRFSPIVRIKTAAAAAPASVTKVTLSAAESSIVDKINGFRAEHGLRPLVVSVGLTAAARQHSLEMVRRGYFAHESADGGSFDKRIGRFYRFRSAGENIAYGCPDLSPSEAMELWLNSPPHLRNMLNGRFREIGISLVHVESAGGPDFQGDPTTVVTTDFGSR